MKNKFEGMKDSDNSIFIEECDDEYFVNFFSNRMEYLEKTETFVRNIYTIGNLTFNAIECENQSLQSLDVFKALMKDLVYRVIFLMF